MFVCSGTDRSKLESGCPVEGVYTGRLPDDPSMCAKLEAPCIDLLTRSSSRNHYTVLRENGRTNSSIDVVKTDKIDNISARSESQIKLTVNEVTENDILQVAESVSGAITLVTSNALTDGTWPTPRSGGAADLQYSVFPCSDLDIQDEGDSSYNYIAL